MSYVAKTYFQASVSGEGVVAIHAFTSTGSMRFLGASVPVGAKPGDNMIGQIYAHLPEDIESGVVALVSMTEANRQTVFHPVFLSIARVDDKVWVDLEKPWIPAAGRFGQIYNDHVEIEIDGQRYTSGLAAGQPMLHVPDGNLLCRYLDGKAEADEVAAAAEAQVTEASAREELKRVRDQLDALAQVEVELAATKLVISRKRQEIKSLRSLMRSQMTFIQSLLRRLTPWWRIKSRATKLLLEDAGSALSSYGDFLAEAEAGEPAVRLDKEGNPISSTH